MRNFNNNQVKVIDFICHTVTNNNTLDPDCAMGVSHLPYQYVDINTVQGLKLLCMYSLLHKPILPSLIVHANTAMDGCKSTLYGPPTCFGHLCCHPQGGTNNYKKFNYKNKFKI